MNMTFNYVGIISENSEIYDFYLSEDKTTVAKIKDDCVTMLSQADKWIDAAISLDSKNRTEGNIPDYSISVDVEPMEYEDKEYILLKESAGAFMAFNKTSARDVVVLPRSPELIEALQVSTVAAKVREVTQ